MLCRNCQKEIGQLNACRFCGFDPALDSGDVPITPELPQTPPPPVKITPIKSTNAMAVTALITSFFSIVPLCGIFPFFFGIIGFFKAKKCRSGRFMSIISLLITLLCTAAYVALGYYLYMNPEILKLLFS